MEGAAMSDRHSDPYMPIYWGAYARDTGHLDAAGHGAYLMLIKHYWCTGEPLPDDDRVLRRIACCDTMGRWRKLRPVIAKFFVVADGVWRHRRVEAELQKPRGTNAQKSVAGRAGAAVRWGNNGQADDHDGTAMAEPMADAMAEPMAAEVANGAPDDGRTDGTARATSESDQVSSEAIASSQNGHSPNGHRKRGRYPPDLERALANATLMAEFGAFWEAYPHKVKRLRAIVAFATARKTATLAEILAGAERYGPTVGGPDQPRPANPDTWLGQERWTDQPLNPGDVNGQHRPARRASAYDTLVAGFARAAGVGSG
jgi:uncharacterized protein YdaU (DUF1376 family)